VRLVLGLGGGARVLEPPELAAEVARRARAALAASGPPGDTPPGDTPAGDTAADDGASARTGGGG
jgi:hypothetical protein